MSGYNNAAFNSKYERCDGRDSLNNRLELGGFQAYNETFIDDNGLEVWEEEYVDFHEDYQRAKPGPKCRRSIAVVPRHDYGRKTVSYHRDRFGSLDNQRCRYESVSSDDRSSEITRAMTSPFHVLQKRFEEIEAANEEYVDYPEERLGISELPTRESPLGGPGARLQETPSSSPRKLLLTPRKNGTPTKVSRRDTIILAPMIANIERQRLHRSKSTIVSSPKKPILRRSPQRRPHLTVQSHLSHGRSMPSLKYVTPAKLNSFNHLLDSELDQQFDRIRSPNRKPITAVISPNIRSSIAPLLPATPPREPISPPRIKSPSMYSKVSWATLPTIHLPTEMLCCVGFMLLLAGAASVILSFYILSIGSRKYFLNFGAIAGFVSLLMGLFSCRTNKWKWLPHRNYLTGYILLGTFSLLNASCLGGIVYALDIHSYALLDTLGGAVCGVSTLVILCSAVGMVTSGCCHRPPPDNRVAHSVSGFIV